MRIVGTVQDGLGRVLGYRCNTCSGVFQTMWGNICNQCRDIERRHQEILKAIKDKQEAGG